MVSAHSEDPQGQMAGGDAVQSRRSGLLRTRSPRKDEGNVIFHIPPPTLPRLHACRQTRVCNPMMQRCQCAPLGALVEGIAYAEFHKSLHVGKDKSELCSG